MLTFENHTCASIQGGGKFILGKLESNLILTQTYSEHRCRNVKGVLGIEQERTKRMDVFSSASLCAQVCLKEGERMASTSSGLTVPKADFQNEVTSLNMKVVSQFVKLGFVLEVCYL